MDVLSSCLDEDTDVETDDGDGMANETGDVCSECAGLAAAEASLSSLLLMLSLPATATSVVLATDTDGADEESPMMISLVLLLLLLLLLLLFTVVSSRGLGALFGDVRLAFLVVFINQLQKCITKNITI